MRKNKEYESFFGGCKVRNLQGMQIFLPKDLQSAGKSDRMRILQTENGLKDI